MRVNSNRLTEFKVLLAIILAVLLLTGIYKLGRWFELRDSKSETMSTVRTEEKVLYNGKEYRQKDCDALLLAGFYPDKIADKLSDRTAFICVVVPDNCAELIHELRFHPEFIDTYNETVSIVSLKDFTEATAEVISSLLGRDIDLCVSIDMGQTQTLREIISESGISAEDDVSSLINGLCSLMKNEPRLRSRLFSGDKPLIYTDAGIGNLINRAVELRGFEKGQYYEPDDSDSSKALEALKMKIFFEECSNN